MHCIISIKQRTKTYYHIFLIFSSIYFMWKVVYVCDWCTHIPRSACMWRPEEAKYTALLFLALFFWEKVSHWTWSSVPLGWLAKNLQHPPVSTPNSSGHWNFNQWECLLFIFLLSVVKQLGKQKGKWRH